MTAFRIAPALAREDQMPLILQTWKAHGRRGTELRKEACSASSHRNSLFHPQVRLRPLGDHHPFVAKNRSEPRRRCRNIPLLDPGVGSGQATRCPLQRAPFGLRDIVRCKRAPSDFATVVRYGGRSGIATVCPFAAGAFRIRDIGRRRGSGNRAGRSAAGENSRLRRNRSSARGKGREKSGSRDGMLRDVRFIFPRSGPADPGRMQRASNATVFMKRGAKV